MTWLEFNNLVRTYLLVDSDRKGRGIQKYINQNIVAGVKDLQEYVDQLKIRNVETYFENDMLDVPTGTNSSEVEFAYTHATINYVVVSGLEVDETTRWYSYVQMVPWSNRYNVTNGCPARSKQYSGRVTFGDGKMFLCSPLKDDQKLYVYWTGLKNEYDDADLVVFDDMIAKAVADYVKAHLNREVDKDIGMYESYLEMYSKQRQQIFRKWKDYIPTTAIDHASSSTNTGVGSDGFTIG